MKKILADYLFEEIEDIVEKLGEKRFRAKQIFEGVYQGKEICEMTNLPKSLVSRLEEEYVSCGVEIVKSLVSERDGTRKYIFRLIDGNVIEGVFMKYRYGNTICVSTQVGCRMNCSFCASGLDGLIRDLTAGEILSQILKVNRDAAEDTDKRSVTNIVLMGSGEPFDNYDNVTKFLRLVSDERGINISKRNISLSTSGLADKIYRFADEGYGVTLTISLHAPNNGIRNKIMPVNKAFKIEELVKAAKYYFDKTGRRIIFEYSMIEGVNDSRACALELVKLVRGLTCHINIINLNYVKERNLRSSSKDNVKEFMDILSSEGVSCTLRRSMGGDIEGACGQLRRRYISEGADGRKG